MILLNPRLNSMRPSCRVLLEVCAWDWTARPLRIPIELNNQPLLTGVYELERLDSTRKCTLVFEIGARFVRRVNMCHKSKCLNAVAKDVIEESGAGSETIGTVCVLLNRAKNYRSGARIAWWADRGDATTLHEE